MTEKTLADYEALRLAFSEKSNDLGGGYKKYESGWKAGDGTAADQLQSGHLAQTAEFFAGIQRWIFNAFYAPGISVSHANFKALCASIGETLYTSPDDYGFRRAVSRARNEENVLETTYERGIAPKGHMGPGLVFRGTITPDYDSDVPVSLQGGFSNELGLYTEIETPEYASEGYRAWAKIGSQSDTATKIFHRNGAWYAGTPYTTDLYTGNPIVGIKFYDSYASVASIQPEPPQTGWVVHVIEEEEEFGTVSASLTAELRNFTEDDYRRSKKENPYAGTYHRSDGRPWSFYSSAGLRVIDGQIGYWEIPEDDGTWLYYVDGNPYSVDVTRGVGLWFPPNEPREPASTLGPNIGSIPDWPLQQKDLLDNCLFEDLTLALSSM